MSGDSFSRIMELGSSDDAEIAPVASGGDAFSRISGTAEPLRQPASFGIDFDQPKAVVRKQIAKLPAADRKAAMRQWADVFVKNERAANKGSLGQRANDTVRNLARGVPIVGELLDEGSALASSLAGGNYDESLAYQRATDRAIDQESTRLGKIPVVGDVTVGGLTKLVGGVASAPLAPIAQVMRGGALLPSMVNGAVSGAGYGAAHAAAGGEGMEDRAMRGGVGLAAGAVGGAGIPVAAAGAGRALDFIGRAARGNIGRAPPAIRGYHPGARQRVQRAFNDDMGVDQVPAGRSASNPMTGPGRRYAVESGNIGERGSLADMGPNLQGQAGAIAATPGAGARRLNDGLRQRAAGAQGQINQRTDAALGPRVDIVSAEIAARDRANAVAGPLYDQFRQTPIPMTPQLVDVLRRADSAGALRGAARLMEIEGRRPAPDSGEFVDLVKRAVDDMASAARRTGDDNLHRVYSGLAADLRSTVDDILSPGNPGQSVWAQAREAAGEGFQYSEGLERGANAFAKNLSPDQMRADLARQTPIGRDAYVQGARSQVQAKMGNAATQFGENASAAGRTLLGSQNARAKLNTLSNPVDARNLVRTLDAEARMAGTYQNVLQNSRTAARQAAQAELPPIGTSNAANELGKKTSAGLAMEGAYRVLNVLTNGAVNARRLEIASDMADMLIAQGARRDQIAQALLQMAGRHQTSAAQQAAIARIAENIMRGAGPQTVSRLGDFASGANGE